MSPRKRQMRADMLSVVVPDAAIHTMAGKMSKMQTVSKHRSYITRSPRSRLTRSLHQAQKQRCR